MHHINSHYAEKHSHYIDDDSTAGGDQHHVTHNLIVVAHNPLNGQIDQSPSDNPDRNDWDERPEDLCGERREATTPHVV